MIKPLLGPRVTPAARAVTLPIAVTWHLNFALSQRRTARRST